jgi:hypothetical protein
MRLDMRRTGSALRIQSTHLVASVAEPSSGGFAPMSILSKLLLILGVASITYGLARWQIVPEVLSRQEKHFQQFLLTHSSDSTNALQSVVQLRKRVMLSGGLYPGWPQAIFPCAVGFMLVAVSIYVGQKKPATKDDRAA